MKTSHFSLQRSLLSLALMAAFAVPWAHAATLTVDPTAADAASAGDAKCSLREAVLSVNAAANTGDCVANVTEAYGSNDTVTLPAGTYRLTLGGLDEKEVTPATTPPTLTNLPDAGIGDLDLRKSVKMVGAGSGTTRIAWDPAETDPTKTDRIFHIFTTDTTTNVNVAIQGLTLASGKTFEVNLGIGPVPATGPLPTNYYLRRAGGGLALGGAAAIVLVDPNLSGADNANAGGLGGSTGGESGATAYTLVLTDVLVDANSAQGDGGGIYNAAPITATNVVVRNNTSTVNGGGLYNEGNASIINSSLSGNTAEGGGGSFLTGSNTVRFSGTTLNGNRAVGGGAISGRSGVTINMVNSTISGNLGEDVGAGLYTNSPASLRFVTIANNISGAESASAGSGINVYPSGSVVVSLKNVLLSGNKRGWEFATYPNPADDPTLPLANCGYTGSTMTITSLGNNLSSDATCATLVQGTDMNGLDPKIGDLADNTGPTLTHALLADSPALGAGAADTTVTVDQRGVTRDTVPDIGAYEVLAPVVPTGTGGGGGCSINPNAQFDGGLLGLLVAAAGGLLLRRRRNGASR